MASRATLLGALAFAAGRGDRAVPAAVARLARDHRLRQRAGGARPGDPVAHRAGAVRAGAVLRHRRLRGGAGRPLHAGARRVRRGPGGRGLRRHRRLPDRLPAGALPRNLLRDAQPRDVDDPLRHAGEDRDARLDRRLPRRGRIVPRLPAAGRDAEPRAVLAGARGLRARGAAGVAIISARSRARWRCRSATTRSASSSSASRSTG